MRKNLIYPFAIAVIFLITGIIIKDSNDYVLGSNLTLIPGMLFSLSCINIKGKSWPKISVYFVISNIIFLGAVASYFLNDRTYHSIFIGAFFGSLLFQTLVRYIFATKTSWKIILLVSILSLISFVPFQLKWGYETLGFAIFLWMIINAIIINHGTTANRAFTQ